jgi:hypothetical protein
VHGIAGLERNITEKAVSDQPSALARNLKVLRNQLQKPLRMQGKKSAKKLIG